MAAAKLVGDCGAGVCGVCCVPAPTKSNCSSRAGPCRGFSGGSSDYSGAWIGGFRQLMVDAGGLSFSMHSQLDIGEDVVSPYLWARGNFAAGRYRADPGAREP